MRRWMLAVVVTSLGLVGGVSVLAQRSEEAPVGPSLPPPPAEAAPPVASPPPVDTSPTRESLPPVAPGSAELPPPVPQESPRSVQRAAGIPGDDPMEAVEAFVVRNRNEADESIKALTKEAETLRARLAKVEAALERWKGVAEALDLKSAKGVLVPVGGGKPPIVERPTELVPVERVPSLPPVPESR
jgi:hypothetical protein